MKMPYTESEENYWTPQIEGQCWYCKEPKRLYESVAVDMQTNKIVEEPKSFQIVDYKKICYNCALLLG